MDILIEIQKGDAHFLDEVASAEKNSVHIRSGKNFGGNVDLVSAIVTLTGITIPVLGKIIIELIKSKRYVKLKIKGVEIVNITEKNAIEILKKYAKAETKKGKGKR